MSELTERNNQLEEENKKLTEQIKELERQLGMNSTNSSKPPSGDGFKVNRQKKKPIFPYSFEPWQEGIERGIGREIFRSNHIGLL